jgi:general secretion pathway protein G
MILSATDKDRPARVRGGFTLVELLVVIVILALLIGLLLPAINAALRTARKAAVSSEINQLASALAAFKSKYGDYPPSRFLCIESGDYGNYLGNTTDLKNGSFPNVDPTSFGTNDITLGTLVQRSVSAIHKFWPKVSTTGAPPGQFYDFNGNGQPDAHYVLHGHECLVFFLGGVPQPSVLPPNTSVLVAPDATFGMSGFDKNPNNPFTNNIVGNANYGPNRQPPLFEFVPGRLFTDPNSQTGVPGYYDNLGGQPGGASGLNFYAYFSSYGNGGYDPNDVNVNSETDATTGAAIMLSFSVPFPTTLIKGGATSNVAKSSPPNPYTSTFSENLSINPNGPPAVTYVNANTFQIISSGIDGLYGVGGQYLGSSSASATSTNTLPVDPTALINTTDPTIRQREQDNLTNFKAGSLQ